MILKVILFILSAIVLLGMYNYISKQLQISRCRKAVVAIFSVKGITVPAFKSGASYWYPTITIIFEYQQDFDYAKEQGLLKEYLQKVESVYKNINGFEAERAVLFQCQGKFKTTVKPS
jgi:hypothetical protein